MDYKLLTAHSMFEHMSARRIDEKKVKSIAESIREVGLLNPVIVRPGKHYREGKEVDGFEILAGCHRFNAMYRVLNWTEIPCFIHSGNDLQSELVTIDENLCRAELSPAQAAHQTGRRKEIYELLHPETRPTSGGGGGRNNATRRQLGDDIAARFTSDTAKATGRSERAVQRDAARAAALGGALVEIAGTSLDNGAQMDALSKLPISERASIIARAQAGEKVSASTGEQIEAEQKRKLMNAWNSVSPAVQSWFFETVTPDPNDGAAVRPKGPNTQTEDTSPCLM